VTGPNSVLTVRAALGSALPGEALVAGRQEQPHQQAAQPEQLVQQARLEGSKRAAVLAAEAQHALKGLPRLALRRRGESWTPGAVCLMFFFHGACSGPLW